MVLSLSLSALSLLQAQIRSDFVLIPGSFDPRIALDVNSNLHVVTGSSDAEIFYALFDSSGNVIKAPKNISNSKTGYFPRLALSDQHIVVVWWLRQPTVSVEGIVSQLLTTHGDTVSGNIVFGLDCCSLFSPDVTFLNDSTYIVVWSGEGNLTPRFDGIYAQFATTSGRFIGENVQLSDHASDGVDHHFTQVLYRGSSEDFLVLWADDHLGGYRIFARFFSNNGVPQDSSFLISEESELRRPVFFNFAADRQGGFAVVWRSKEDTTWQIRWRRFQVDGKPFAPSERVNSIVDIDDAFSFPDIAYDSEGKCVIVWSQKENGLRQIYVQRFFVDGTQLGDNFRVSTNKPVLDQFSASVLVNNGKIYTAWDALKDSSGTDLVTWANILDFNNPAVSVEDRGGPLATEFHLFQNYPNPFNPTTAIRYAVSRRSQVRLDIFNVLGQVLITLEDEEVIPGIHTVVWSGEDAEKAQMPSGVYLYQLTVNGIIQVRKMLFLR